MASCLGQAIAFVSDLDQHDGDIVGAAALENHGEQLFAGGMWRGRQRSCGDLGVADMSGQPVCAQDENVTGQRLALLEVDVDVVVDADGARDDVAARPVLRLCRADAATYT